MAEYQVLYWRNIPAQVRVYEGKRPLSRELPEKFQKLIDQIAMNEELTGTDDYLDQWHWTNRINRNGQPQEILEKVILELIETFEKNK